MAQTRNPAGQSGASDGSVHATKLNTSDNTHSTTTDQLLCGSLTSSCMEARREFMLTVLRCAKMRVSLKGMELDEIGISLKLGLISPEFAVSWLDHAGLLQFVNGEPYTNKVEVVA